MKCSIPLQFCCQILVSHGLEIMRLCCQKDSKPSLWKGGKLAAAVSTMEW